MRVTGDVLVGGVFHRIGVEGGASELWEDVRNKWSRQKFFMGFFLLWIRDARSSQVSNSLVSNQSKNEVSKSSTVSNQSKNDYNIPSGRTRSSPLPSARILSSRSAEQSRGEINPDNTTEPATDRGSGSFHRLRGFVGESSLAGMSPSVLMVLLVVVWTLVGAVVILGMCLGLHSLFQHGGLKTASTNASVTPPTVSVNTNPTGGAAGPGQGGDIVIQTYLPSAPSAPKTDQDIFAGEAAEAPRPGEREAAPHGVS